MLVLPIKNFSEKRIKEFKALFLKSSIEIAVFPNWGAPPIIFKSVILIPEKNLIASITLISNSAEVISAEDLIFGAFRLPAPQAQSVRPKFSASAKADGSFMWRRYFSARFIVAKKSI